MRINTRQEPLVYINKYCHVCRAEGFTASTRLLVEAGHHHLRIQPVSLGVGPDQEAHDMLAVLNGGSSAPDDLKDRSIILSASVIDLAENCGIREAERQLANLLESGAA